MFTCASANAICKITEVKCWNPDCPVYLKHLWFIIAVGLPSVF